jgi:transcription factor SPN1
MADAEIEDLRRRMAEAAKADNEARVRGEPAVEKLRMLPEVVGMLSRNNIRSSLVDPDINLLESVRFFLEPLNDGSMPAYNIQRDLFNCLEKLPMTKETLIASRIGMIIRFYPKSPIVEPRLKQQAQRFLQAWTRIVLGQQSDYRRRNLQTASYDPRSLPLRNSQNTSSQQSAASKAARERMLANPSRANRAQAAEGPGSYTIVPQSNLMDMGGSQMSGSQADAFFKRIRARNTGKQN